MKLYGLVKRFFDILLALVAIIVLSPVFVISIIGIKLSSPGPVFFTADRVGKDGKNFHMFKFRSMHMNNEKGHMITLRSDSRIFPFGSFLRKSKIDELPQLFNIVKGDMSIVGWRPEDKENVESVFVDEFSEILSYKPGLTSPGSLYDYTHGELYDSEEQYLQLFLPQKMKLELFYVKNQSIFYDIELIFRTILTIALVIFGKHNFKLPRELEKV